MSKYKLIAKCSMCGEMVTLSQEFSTEGQIEHYVSTTHNAITNKSKHRPALHRCKDENFGILEPVGFVKKD